MISLFIHILRETGISSGKFEDTILAGNLVTQLQNLTFEQRREVRRTLGTSQ
jgi:hypothetical protein